MANSRGFGQFARRLRVLADITERNSNRLVRETALLGDRTFALATPVDTGRARASTIVSIGSEASEEVAAPVPGDGGASLTFALARARATLQAYEVTSGSSIFITQTTPYSVFLDEGSSAQAPRGMTKPTAEAMAEFIRRNGGMLLRSV